MASYPGTVKSFTTKTAGQQIASAHVNDMQDEIVAIEGSLLNGITHVVKGADGSVGSPEFTFTNDTDTGVYRSGANALDFATAGVKALGIDSTQFIDSPTQPRALALKSGAQSLTDSTLTAITFDLDGFDIGALHDTSSNTSRLTVPTGGDGLYLILGQVDYAANATGIRMARIKKNNTTVVTTQLMNAVGGAEVTTIQVIAATTLVATDYVELIGYQTSTGALNVTANCQVFMVKLW